MWCCRKACVSDISYQLTALHLLSISHNECMHVSIPCTVSNSMIDLHHLSITTKTNLRVIDLPISRGIDGCAYRRGEVDTRMHFLHFIDRVDPHAEFGCKRIQFFVCGWLYGGNCSKKFVLVICVLKQFFLCL